MTRLMISSPNSCDKCKQKADNEGKKSLHIWAQENDAKFKDII